MNNPIKIWRELKKIYLKYIDSGLPLSNEHLVKERRKLYQEPGVICQPPIIELVPKYEEVATLKEACDELKIDSEFVDFAKCGLFPDSNGIERKLYQHQKDALQNAFVERKHIVATTGTGSGKTECFLLPAIADLVVESKQWNDNRTRAVRTLILYPLNALAEDQMIRLRRSLNSTDSDKTGARNWLDENRNGHRFYFGRYTGKTPVSGNRIKRRVEYNKQKKKHIEEWEAVKKVAAQNDKDGVKELLYHFPCMDSDSAEMWDRWSMQDNPPDILITNYSMLNIMLLRGYESPIFDKTKEWLAEDRENNVFHLVVDEMHTYRGTAGTEVAYLLRLLLKRLGLSPDSPQVQFLASSASMKENEKTEKYITSFFGVENKKYKDKFKLLSNPPYNRIERQPLNEIPHKLFEDFANRSRYLSPEELEGAINNLLKDEKCNSVEEILEKYHIFEWLKYSMQNSVGELVARKTTELAHRLTSGNTPLSESALEGLFLLLCESKEDNGAAIQPIRSHNFFRNIDGLWACSNPNCTEVEEEFKWENRKIGKLYKSPGKRTCNCGGKIYEALICRSCGDIFYYGYKFIDGQEEFIVSNKLTSKDANGIVVLWPNNRVDQDVEKDSDWRNADFDTFTGRYNLNRDGNISVFVPKDGYLIKYPDYCSNCYLHYKIEDEHSLAPISNHGTGVQKVNQVMADAMMRIMKENNISNPKLVLFSDSRQAAAKLSAGIELDHYRDVLRQTVLRSLESEDKNLELLRKLKKEGHYNFSQKEIEIYRQLRADPYYSRIIADIHDHKAGLLSESDAKELKSFFSTQLPELKLIEDKVWKDIASLGINPAGPNPSFLTRSNTEWKELFNWEADPIERIDRGNESRFLEDIIYKCNTEQLVIIFAHKNRSFESLKLGYVTANLKGVGDKYAQFIDIVIRLLGENWRLIGQSNRWPYTGFPRAVSNFAKKAEITFNRDEKDELIRYLREKSIIKDSEVVLTGKGLYFKKSVVGDPMWICSKCHTIHLHPSCGICSNCFSSTLVQKEILNEDLNNQEDYYSYLATGMKPYRLRCEELTGQTSKDDSTKRQRLFQGIFLENENERVDEIDLLSVTTTMEAGVDIGGLSTVMMGNVPPQRFNYQQRVGRAGRRGHALSIALTVAKANSHDQTHYFQTERMVSAKPSDPYLEMVSEEIAKRMIIRQVLHKSFAEINLGDSISDNVHGEFGMDYKWDENRKYVENWINNNSFKISSIINCVIKETDIEKKPEEIASYIKHDLVKDIDEIVYEKRNDYPQKAMSEKLSNAGLLPMFGFPTRVRLLYHEKPQKIPPTKVVDRNLDIAISSFAPGSEIVKDKMVLTSVGFVSYESEFGQVVEKHGINELETDVQICGACGYTAVKDMYFTDCPNCKALGSIEKVRACSPLGFCVDFEADIKDFNGRFEYMPYSTSVSLDANSDLGEPIYKENIIIRSNVLPQNGRVHQINNNNGKRFMIGNLMGTKQHVARDAFDGNKQGSLRIIDEKDYVLIASKTTGVLTVSVNSTNVKLDLSPLFENKNNYKAIRNAFISWGYLLQKSICAFLDIETNEIEVGFHINSDHKGEVFIVESLENGAGYCNYLSGRIHEDVPFKALIKPLIPSKEGDDATLYDKYIAFDHLSNCTSSCYDCIRDFYNQREHGVLDWRLGLDLAKIAYDKGVFIDFSSIYWKEYLVGLAKSFKHYEEVIDSVYIITNRRNRILISHPFWSDFYINELKQTFNFDEAINIVEAVNIVRD